MISSVILAILIVIFCICFKARSYLMDSEIEDLKKKIDIINQKLEGVTENE